MGIMKKASEKWVLAGISFTILFLVCIYKLTNASLWFDETIEFYYSRTLISPVPWDAGGGNMYERIVSTLQPPLYNLLMFFWLKISESEWWFRFFGVVMGVAGAAGVYKSVEKIWNYRAAAVSVVILACTKQYIYYVQECAEYNLMLAGLCWLMYAWICLMEKADLKRILGYLSVAVICVYSQYGAIFPVAAFSVTALGSIFYRKEKREILQMLAGYIFASVFAAVPLWVLFLSKQMQHQQSSTVHAFEVTNGVLQDVYYAVRTVMGWCFAYNASVFLAIEIFLFLLVLSITEKMWMKWLVAANLLCWFLYYAAVKYSFYGYGYFGNRYNLFFIPVWLVSFLAVLSETKEIIMGFFDEEKGHKTGKAIFRAVSGAACLLAAFVFCLAGWGTIKPNWVKEDIRGAVNAWYDAEGYNCDTLIYYASDSGFSYYCEHNERYNGSTLDNVSFMQWYANRTADEYSAYLDEIYKDGWPDSLYMVASHTERDIDTILQCFADKGYAANDIYYKNGGRLIYLAQAYY